jgi:hypothetical protein
MGFIIEYITLETVSNADKNMFNNGNLYEIRPDDYSLQHQLVETQQWVDKFHKQYSTIVIPSKYLRWLKEASYIGSFTGNIPNSYEEEINVLSEELNNKYGNDYLQTGYFVRTETVSLKSGVHGCKAYKTMKDIIESSVTSRHDHTPINERTTELCYYLLPWLSNVDDNKEFRVFVKNGKVLAISQQHLYQSNSYLQDPTTRDSIVANWCKIIVDYIHSVVVPRIDHINSYVMDICLLDCEEITPLIHDQDNLQLQPYFIEINPYGKNYGSGSSLFNWITHSHILESPQSDDIYVRMTI